MTYWGQISGNLISLFTFGHIFCQLTDCQAKQWTILFPCKGYVLALKGATWINNLNCKFYMYFVFTQYSESKKRVLNTLTCFFSLIISHTGWLRHIQAGVDVSVCIRLYYDEPPGPPTGTADYSSSFYSDANVEIYSLSALTRAHCTQISTLNITSPAHTNHSPQITRLN